MKSDNNNKKVYCAGTKFSSMLGVAFIVLKLCHVIDWAWIWVLTPLWAPLAFVLVMLLITLTITGIIFIIQH